MDRETLLLLANSRAPVLQITHKQIDEFLALLDERDGRIKELQAAADNATVQDLTIRDLTAQLQTRRGDEQRLRDAELKGQMVDALRGQLADANACIKVRDRQLEQEIQRRSETQQLPDAGRWAEEIRSRQAWLNDAIETLTGQLDRVPV